MVQSCTDWYGVHLYSLITVPIIVRATSITKNTVARSILRESKNITMPDAFGQTYSALWYSFTDNYTLGLHRSTLGCGKLSSFHQEVNDYIIYQFVYIHILLNKIQSNTAYVKLVKILFFISLFSENINILASYKP